MKVLLVNGSPHEHGCTDTALREVASVLEKQGIGSRIFWLGAAPQGGCMGCGGCHATGKCVFGGPVNELADLVKEYDGYVFGAPVHYAGPAANLCGVMDRLWITSASAMRFKPAAAVASARRAGTTASLDRIQKYFTINNMITVGSKYWNNVHGGCPADVQQDEEGLQIMRQLGTNMAWILKCLEAGKAAGIELPQLEAPIKTNYIR